MFTLSFGADPHSFAEGYCDLGVAGVAFIVAHDESDAIDAWALARVAGGNDWNWNTGCRDHADLSPGVSIAIVYERKSSKGMVGSDAGHEKTGFIALSIIFQ